MSASRYVLVGTKDVQRMDLYEALDDEGRYLVDYLGAKLIRGLNAQNPRLSFGPLSARELALALLEHTWNGELPEKFPRRVEGME